MGMWSEKVVPMFHKLFGKDDPNKADAEQACKSFDESKDEISKEFEEKKGVLKPKVIEIYEASSTEVKSLIKEPKEHDLKKHSDKVKKFLDKLVKTDFPGSKAASEVSTKYGLSLAAGPALFIFEKVSLLVVTEEPQATVTTREPPAAAIASREVDISEVKAPPPQPQATSATVTSREPPAAITTAVTKEDKALPPAQPQATKEPPATVATTVNKEDKALKPPQPQATLATKEPPAAVTTTATASKEVVVEKAVVKEPQKVDVKKEEPLKKA